MRTFMRWTLRIVGAVVLLALVAGAALYGVGRSRLGRTYAVAQALPDAPADAAVLAHGERIMRTHGCQACHAEDLGGKVFLDIPPGRFVASNLTGGKGGVAGAYRTAADWDRAVRYGVRPDGRMIVPMMPYRLYHRLSDADAAALVAYLRRLPAVDRPLPATEVRTVGYLMAGTPAFRPSTAGVASTAPRAPTPPAGPTAAYGQYLASTRCVECHGESLTGGQHPAPEAPPGPSLAHAGRWPYADFARAVREGVTPGGRRLGSWMPSDLLRHLTDTEMQALHAYFATLPTSSSARTETAAR